MRKIVKVLLTAAAAASLSACSSSAASSAKSSDASSTKEINTEYTETADVSSMEFKDATVQEVTYSVPSEWRKSLDSANNETDYKNTDSKDKIEVRFIEGADADLKGLIDSTQWAEPFTFISSEDAEIGGVNGLHAVGTSVIYDTIMYDCNAEMYLMPVKEGTVVFEFLQDPNGTVDYKPVFEKVIESVKAA